MNQAFENAFAKTLKNEGGYSNDPLDNGNWTGGRRNTGELRGTKYGISAASYPNEDIENLTLERAKELYKKDFWDSINLDIISETSEEIAIELFDTGVNMGTGIAAIFLQRALNLLNKNQKEYSNIPVDGGIGPLTLRAFHSNKKVELLFNLLNFLQADRYIQLMEKNEAYEKYIGWFNRIEIYKS